MNAVLREEIKYLVSMSYMVEQRHYLKHVMLEDPHNGDNGYSIRSLYFDTVNNKDLFEKESGIELRRKIRLRIYDPMDQTAKLEMKQKQGPNQKKRSLSISRQDAMEMIKGNYDVLLQYPDSFAAECFALMRMQGYRPVAVVDYKRSAFIAKENNIRITFDHDITATECNFDIFDSNLLQYPVFAKYNVVMEVKYNGFLLSYIKEMIERTDKLPLSASKYSMSRKATYRYFV